MTSLVILGPVQLCVPTLWPAALDDPKRNQTAQASLPSTEERVFSRGEDSPWRRRVDKQCIPWMGGDHMGAGRLPGSSHREAPSCPCQRAHGSAVETPHARYGREALHTSLPPRLPLSAWRLRDFLDPPGGGEDQEPTSGPEGTHVGQELGAVLDHSAFGRLDVAFPVHDRADRAILQDLHGVREP